MIKNKLAAALMAATAILMLTACTASTTDDKDNSSAADKASTSQSETDADNKASSAAKKFLSENFPSNGAAEILNLRAVKAGEEIAVVKTNMGEIKIMLFPEVAPKAVENFKGLASGGYYDNLTFHRVIADFMIQGGDPTGTGTGGESFFGKAFEDEFSEQALNLRGALCMANSGANTNGSQFFIVQAPKESITPKIWDMLEQKNDALFPDTVKKAYEENGGAPWLDFSHTVFGQVYEGMDVIDEISKVSVDVNAKPADDVVIESVKIEKAKL